VLSPAISKRYTAHCFAKEIWQARGPEAAILTLQDGQALAFAGDGRRRSGSASGGTSTPAAAAVAAGPTGETGQPMGGAEQRLRHCLTARTRRWAVGEFFYSAIDRPWFMQNELKARRDIVVCWSTIMKLSADAGKRLQPSSHPARRIAGTPLCSMAVQDLSMHALTLKS